MMSVTSPAQPTQPATAAVAKHTAAALLNKPGPLASLEMHEKLYIRHMLLPPDRDSTSDGQEIFISEHQASKALTLINAINF